MYVYIVGGTVLVLAAVSELGQFHSPYMFPMYMYLGKNIINAKQPFHSSKLQKIGDTHKHTHIEQVCQGSKV